MAFQNARKTDSEINEKQFAKQKKMKKQASYELSMKNTGRQTSLSSANTSVMLLYVVGSQESRWSFQFYIRTKN